MSAAYPEHLREAVEGYLAALDFDAVAPARPLVEAMRYSLLAGGKRIRPVLCLAVAEREDRDPATLLPFAAALELIHTYSLIHDDLPAIDDDALRRGKPTCHVVFGEDVAILAGDGLFAEAFRLVLERQAGDAAALVGALGEIAAATGVRGMVGGQYMDVTGSAADDDELRLLHELKTGRLIEAAVAGGAVLCGVGRTGRERPVAARSGDAAAGRLPGADRFDAYRAFAREIGLLFQIVDDILDVEGDTAELGKSAGNDARLEKVTYVSRFGVEGARRLARESHARAGARLDALGGDTASLRAVTDHILTRRS